MAATGPSPAGLENPWITTGKKGKKKAAGTEGGGREGGFPRRFSPGEDPPLLPTGSGKRQNQEETDPDLGGDAGLPKEPVRSAHD